MEIYRELYQISKSLSEFTAKARKLHTLMKNEDWREQFYKEFQSFFHDVEAYGTLEEVTAFIQSLLDQQKEESKKEGFKRGFQDAQQITKQELLEKINLPDLPIPNGDAGWAVGYGEAARRLEELKKFL
jgi:hypothetical protein